MVIIINGRPRAVPEDLMEYNLATCFNGMKQRGYFNSYGDLVTSTGRIKYSTARLEDAHPALTMLESSIEEFEKVHWQAINNNTLDPDLKAKFIELQDRYLMTEKLIFS